MEPRTWAALVTVILSLLPTAPAEAGNVTAFELQDDGSVVVPVTIGGTGPYRFVIDTGSSRTVISTRLFRSLNRPALARTLLLTPAGDRVTSLVPLDQLAIAGRPIGNVMAAVLPQDRDAGGRIDGLIGQDVLANEIYSLDYRRRVIVWHAEGDVLEGERIVVIARNNRLLVRLPQRAHDSHPIELIPDSGAAGVVVFAHAAGKLRFTMHEIGVLSSVSGTRVARRITIEDLVIGDTHLRQHTAAMVPDSRPAGLLGDGLLPLHLFSRVTFNVAEGFVIFQQR
jgi:predicted aspartyl protease